MTKKMISIAAVLLMGASYTQAQLYVRAGVGYGMATSKETNDYTNTSSATTFSNKNVANTAGAGLQAGAAFGFGFSEHFGGELGVQYLMGSKTTSTDNNTTNSTSETTTSKSTQIRLMPALVVKTGGENIEPYARLGVILPVGGSTTTTSTTKSTLTEVIQEYKTTGSFSMGWHSALGINYHLGEKMSIFGELGVQSLSIGGKKTEVTKYTVDGVDKLGDLKTIQKEVNYVTEISETSNGHNATPDLTKPSEMLRTYRQFGNAGVNVGIQFSF